MADTPAPAPTTAPSSTTIAREPSAPITTLAVVLLIFAAVVTVIRYFAASPAEHMGERLLTTIPESAGALAVVATTGLFVAWGSRPRRAQSTQSPRS